MSKCELMEKSGISSEVTPVTIVESFLFNNIQVSSSCGTVHIGGLIAVDPVSNSCVLWKSSDPSEKIQNEDIERSKICLMLIPQVRWDSINVLPTSSEEKEQLKRQLSALVTERGSPDIVKLSSQELVDRKASLVKFFAERHHESVLKGDDIVVKNCVTISPPYDHTTCKATNEIVLARITDLVRQFDSEKPEPLAA